MTLRVQRSIVGSEIGTERRSISMIKLKSSAKVKIMDNKGYEYFSSTLFRGKTEQERAIELKSGAKAEIKMSACQTVKGTP